MIEARGVTKVYGAGTRAVAAVRDVSAAFEPGLLHCLWGPSGSGKTTLLHLLAGIDAPTSGGVFVDGEGIGTWDDARASAWRRRHVGFVFQFFNLLPALTARENAGLPLLLDGKDGREVRERAASALERVGLAGRADRRPAELSGGEMQRVAVARAIAADPAILLGDEPTGNLDTETGASVIGLLKGLAAEGRTVIVATHDTRIAEGAGRVLRLLDGAVASDEKRA
ncbi:MAG: ABC transporter ATP-binding protein [Planctomycetes bacterium]|nr:ABC transporter ATP-binding protein [Planctomycetota bacterium]